MKPPPPKPPPPTESTIIRTNIDECKKAHQSDTYFNLAEPFMDRQWDHFIWPRIRTMDFSRILELAPGYGRNTAKLLPLATEIHLVDVNASCIHRCQQRFASHPHPPKLFYYINDGQSLSDLPSNYFTLIYSWDAMVHFDKLVIRQYVKEFARVMAPAAKGFIHHSNFGTISQDTNWQFHPHWRSNMTASLFPQYAQEANLQTLTTDPIPWGGQEEMDCISTFAKP